MFWIIVTAVILAVLIGDYFWIICLVTAAVIVIYLISKYVNKKQEEVYIAERLAEEKYRKKDPDESYRDAYVKHYQSTQPKDPLDTYKADYAKHIQSMSSSNSISDKISAASHAASNADRVDSFSRYGVASAPNVWQGCPMVYQYKNLAVKNVNRDLLWSIVKAKDFDLQPIKNESGAILLKWHGTTIAQLIEKADMCSDWLDKQLPIRCEFMVFATGKEKVALSFYKDQESALQNRKCEIVKLTAYLTDSKQETISFLEEGEKLFVEWDDDERPYLRDISYNPVGKLPARFTEYCENDLIDGVFFDHTETKESDGFDKADKLIPFVRVYTSEE